MTFAPKTWVVGEVVSAATMNTEIRDQFNSMFAAWTTYTPTWTGATTNPVLGNGVITGRYIKVGRTCTASIQLTTGSTTTYGSGAYSFGVPFIAASATVAYIGAARLSGTDTWLGHILLGQGATVGTLTFSATATNTRGANMAAAVPETLAAGALLRATVTYQTAT
ncbi:hypothetical protein [Streptomyces sp. NPDC001876]|uniref:hypothetical protein n=1 Tax=Streptomyces sp. NPDC001876 TaxID=3154402 RepID=UPI0033176640